MDGAKYKDYDIELRPGDKIFVYTDGVPEAMNSNGELFGTDRMIAALNSKENQDPTQVLKTVRAAVDDYVGNAEQFDDLTMLCLEYLGK
jgi:serine phosphatase RsbU (regulator of sigma subunit)